VFQPQAKGLDRKSDHLGEVKSEDLAGPEGRPSRVAKCTGTGR